MARPFWIREAKLPAGFPPPGPVGQAIIKEYPAYRMARYTASESQPTDQNAMFWPLFNHIKRNEIAMTAPVEMSYPAAITSRPEAAASTKPIAMAFLYREHTLGTTGADRADPRVVVEDSPAMTVLSVGVRGNYSAKHLANALRRIHQWTIENPGRVELIGQPRYLGYNSPMVPGFLRYGEVQVPVRSRERVPPANPSGPSQHPATLVGPP